MKTSHNAAITDRRLATGVRPSITALALTLGLFLVIVLGRGAVARPGGIDPVAGDPWDGALMMTPSNLEDEVVRADTIVAGRVTSQASHNVQGSIETDVTISAERAQKGQAGSNLTFTVPGGQIGTKHVFVGGVPNFVAGERVLLFLRNPRAGETLPHLVQIWQSKYTLAGANALQAEGSAPLPIPQVEQRISAVLGRQVTIGTTANTTTTAAFTSSCPAWTASQIPVPYRVNGSLGTNIMPESAFVAATQTAWASWTSIPGVSIRSTFAGTGGDATVNGDGINVIAWGDVSSLGPNVIGVNSCVSSNGVRVDSDTQISNSVSWDLDPSDGISPGLLSLYSVETHELGHGIGIGHPCEQATCNFNGSGGLCDTGPNTPVMCPVISTGVNKTIQQDDRDAALSFYPGGTTTPPPAGSHTASGLESPAAGTVAQSFPVSGWAIDSGAPSGTGVDAVHVYVYPSDASGNVTGAGQFLGQASYGASRPDIAGLYGSRFSPSGFTFSVNNLAVGNYQLTVFFRSTVTGSFTPMQHLIKVAAATSQVAAALDAPAAGNVNPSFAVSGWAVDKGATTGTGVDTVHVYVYPTNSSGVVTGAAQFLGQATYGSPRPDIGSLEGNARFTPSGYMFNVTNLAVGNYQLTIFIHSSFANSWTPLIRLINVTGPVSQVGGSIDAPAAGNVGQSFQVNGWAIDKGAPTGTGVDQVHVYVYPTNASGVVTGAAQFLGQASYGISRPDIGAVNGSRFTPSGYSLNVTNLATGNYQLTVFFHSTLTGNFTPMIRLINVTGPVSVPIMSIDTPAAGSTVGPTYLVNGWAADQGSSSGTGVDTVHVYVYPTDAAGNVTGAAIFLGQATYGINRSDVGAAYGSRFSPSGYTLSAPGPAPGNYQLAVFAHSSVTGAWNVLARQIK